MGDRDVPVEVIVELLNRRFDAIDVRLDDLTDQVRLQNGRVRSNEMALASLSPRMESLRHDMRDVKGDVATLKQRKEETGENRTIKAWHVYYGIACIGITITVLAFLGKLHP